MIILFWVVMILFSIVKTKIVHYSSMAWFPVSYLAATVLYSYLNGALQWNRWLTIGIAIIGGVLALLITALPLVGMNAADLIPYIKDRFAAANLTAPSRMAGLGMDDRDGVWTDHSGFVSTAAKTARRQCGDLVFWRPGFVVVCVTGDCS